MTIIKKFEPPKNRDNFWQSKKFTLAVIMVVVLIFLQIWTNNSVSSLSEKFNGTSKLSQDLILANHLLENDIAKSSSIASIATKSATYGFAKPKTVQYLR